MRHVINWVILYILKGIFVTPDSILGNPRNFIILSSVLSSWIRSLPSILSPHLETLDLYNRDQLLNSSFQDFFLISHFRLGALCHLNNWIFISMEGAAVESSPSCYVSWEELNLSSDKGRREVHYYLKKQGGNGSDLVVIGKERSLRHMSYHYVNKNILLSLSTTTPLFKLKSRREVIHWLNSIISGIIIVCFTLNLGLIRVWLRTKSKIWEFL